MKSVARLEINDVPKVGRLTPLLTLLTAVAFARAPGPADALHIEPFAALSESYEAILEDRYGFLWLAAQDGLHRFDGYQSETFSPSASDGESNATIRDMVEDRQGRIWVATFGGGLSVFDPVSEKFTRFNHDPQNPASLSDDATNCLFVDPKGTLWIGTESGGVCAYNGTSFRRFQHSGAAASLSPGRVRGIANAGSGKLWVLTLSGLDQLNTETGAVTHFRASIGGLPEDSITAIESGANGDLWAGCQGVVFRLEAKTGTWKRHDAASGNIGRINDFTEDTNGFLWIGTDAGIYALAAGTQSPVAIEVDKAGSEPPVVKKIMMDRRGCTWFLTYGMGLLRANPHRLAFKNLAVDAKRPNSLSSNLVTSIIEDRAGNLWVGTYDRGLNLIARGQDEVLRILPDDGHGLDHATIYFLLESRDGTLWVSTDGGLYHSQPSSEPQFVNVASKMPDMSDISGLIEDSNGTFWLGSYSKGVARYDRARSQIIERYSHDPKRAASLSENLVLTMLLDDHRGLWVGTFNGLNLIDRDGHVKRFGNAEGLSNLVITCMSLDANGHLWLGTNGGGLNEFDPEAGRVVRVKGNHDGLPNPNVMAMARDGKGNLWISTTKGLARMDAKTGNCRYFDASDGLPTGEFMAGSAYLNREGRMFFGSTRGLVSFRPDALKVSNEPPHVLLTRLNLADGPVRLPYAETVNADGSPTAASFELSHREKMFSVEITVLDLLDPAKNRFAYRVLGFDEHWTDANASTRYATFTNLDPGNYTLQVKAINVEGVWSEQPRELKIRVNSHPLLSLQAKLAYGLVVLLVVAGYVRLQRIALRNVRELASRDRAMAQQERRHKERLEQEVRERTGELVDAQKRLITQEKLASLGTLAAGVAHEIRNPLNFVANFAAVIDSYIQEMQELIESEKSDAALRRELCEILSDMDESARGIVRHSRRAEEIVKSMMAFAQNRKLEIGEAKINELVREYANLAFQRPQATNRSIDLYFELSPDVGAIPVDAHSLSRVVLNLVGNAVEAVHERFEREEDHHGEIWVRTARQGDEVYIKIRDNGLGISKENQVRIFRPFFTTKDRGSQNIGLGLSISYDIVVAQHGGRLEVESEIGIFTEMTVVLPVVQEVEGEG